MASFDDYFTFDFSGEDTSSADEGHIDNESVLTFSPGDPGYERQNTFSTDYSMKEPSFKLEPGLTDEELFFPTEYYRDWVRVKKEPAIVSREVEDSYDHNIANDKINKSYFPDWYTEQKSKPILTHTHSYQTPDIDADSTSNNNSLSEDLTLQSSTDQDSDTISGSGFTSSIEDDISSTGSQLITTKAQYSGAFGIFADARDKAEGDSRKARVNPKNTNIYPDIISENTATGITYKLCIVNPDNPNDNQVLYKITGKEAKAFQTYYDLVSGKYPENSREFKEKHNELKKFFTAIGYDINEFTNKVVQIADTEYEGSSIIDDPKQFVKNIFADTTIDQKLQIGFLEELASVSSNKEYQRNYRKSQQLPNHEVLKESFSMFDNAPKYTREFFVNNTHTKVDDNTLANFHLNQIITIIQDEFNAPNLVKVLKSISRDELAKSVDIWKASTGDASETTICNAVKYAIEQKIEIHSERAKLGFDIDELDTLENSTETSAIMHSTIGAVNILNSQDPSIEATIVDNNSESGTRTIRLNKELTEKYMKTLKLMHLIDSIGEKTTLTEEERSEIYSLKTELNIYYEQMGTSVDDVLKNTRERLKNYDFLKNYLDLSRAEQKKLVLLYELDAIPDRRIRSANDSRVYLTIDKSGNKTITKVSQGKPVKSLTGEGAEIYILLRKLDQELTTEEREAAEDELEYILTRSSINQKEFRRLVEQHNQKRKIFPFIYNVENSSEKDKRHLLEFDALSQIGFVDLTKLRSIDEIIDSIPSLKSTIDNEYIFDNKYSYSIGLLPNKENISLETLLYYTEGMTSLLLKKIENKSIANRTGLRNLVSIDELKANITELYRNNSNKLTLQQAEDAVRGYVKSKAINVEVEKKAISKQWLFDRFTTSASYYKATEDNDSFDDNYKPDEALPKIWELLRQEDNPYVLLNTYNEWRLYGEKSPIFDGIANELSRCFDTTPENAKALFIETYSRLGSGSWEKYAEKYPEMAAVLNKTKLNGINKHFFAVVASTVIAAGVIHESKKEANLLYNYATSDLTILTTIVSTSDEKILEIIDKTYPEWHKEFATKQDSVDAFRYCAGTRLKKARIKVHDATMQRNIVLENEKSPNLPNRQNLIAGFRIWGNEIAGAFADGDYDERAEGYNNATTYLNSKRPPLQKHIGELTKSLGPEILISLLSAPFEAARLASTPSKASKIFKTIANGVKLTKGIIKAGTLMHEFEKINTRVNENKNYYSNPSWEKAKGFAKVIFIEAGSKAPVIGNAIPVAEEAYNIKENLENQKKLFQIQ